MANPTPTADTNVLIKTAAQKLAQIDSIDQQSKQHQASLEAWAKQRETLLAEVDQLKAAIKNGTEWPPVAANNPAQ
jgi:anti-sigma28 factor (negative regulator of flagellin synthesis)